MLEFKRLDKNVDVIRNYLEKSDIPFCNLTVGVMYLWREDASIDYAFYNDTLILKETCRDYTDGFYFPIGSDIEGAFLQIEEYGKLHGGKLTFCYMDIPHTVKMLERYKKANVYSNRDSSDYIYDAESFKTFAGKKYSGQRNHKNKFTRLYPNYKFTIITQDNLDKVKQFILDYENETTVIFVTEQEERDTILDFAENSIKLKQLGGFIEVDDKVVAIAIGERVKDTLVVHVEKGLKEYEGVYQVMASEYSKAFAVDGITLLNREDDCGDMGLRTSKLQYHPVEIKEKNIITVNTPFDKINSPIYIKTDRLEITEIKENDLNYQKLYLDENVNKLWGYDYKEDLNGEPTKEYFYSFMKGLKDKKEEYSLSVNLDKEMIGELVMWNFGFDNSLEIGFRFFSKYQNKGYGFESASALIEYIKSVLKVGKIKTRCYKQNLPSQKLIKKLGFNLINENEEYFFYEM